MHVIEPYELPPFADSPVLEADAFEREFRIRAASSRGRRSFRVRFEMRVGDAPDALRDAARSSTSISSCWHGTATSRRATVASCERCSPEPRFRWRHDGHASGVRRASPVRPCVVIASSGDGRVPAKATIDDAGSSP